MRRLARMVHPSEKDRALRESIRSTSSRPVSTPHTHPTPTRHGPTCMVIHLQARDRPTEEAIDETDT
jgi:hypothetical protein